MRPCSIFPRRKEYRANTTALFDRQVKDVVLRETDGAFTEWARQEMVRQRQHGQTVLELMRRFGASECVVRRIVGKREMKSTHLADLIDPKVVIQMLDDGKTWQAIGDHFGVSESTVRKLVHGRRKRRSKSAATYETWLPIRDFEGLYEVSSAGRVRSLDRVRVQVGRGGKPSRRVYRGRIIGQYESKGTFIVSLHRPGKSRYLKVHILACEAFHGPAPEGKPCVSFADGNLHNNASSNLSWSSRRLCGPKKRVVLR